MPDGYVDRREAARLAGVSWNTIRNWEKRGLLRTHKEEQGQERVLVNVEDLMSLKVERPAARQGETDRERELLAERQQLFDLIERYERLIDHQAEEIKRLAKQGDVDSG